MNQESLSIDEVIETLKSTTPHNLIFASQPSKNYSIRKLFEIPSQTEYFVRHEQDKEKIKTLMDVIYNKFFIVDDLGFSNESMGKEYIANIVYPLAVQGRLQDVPQEYVYDSIRYFEEKATKNKNDADRFTKGKRGWGDIGPFNRIGEHNYCVSEDFQKKANLISREYFLLPKVGVSGTQA